MTPRQTHCSPKANNREDGRHTALVGTSLSPAANTTPVKPKGMARAKLHETERAE